MTDTEYGIEVRSQKGRPGKNGATMLAITANLPEKAYGDIARMARKENLRISSYARLLLSRAAEVGVTPVETMEAVMALREAGAALRELARIAEETGSLDADALRAALESNREAEKKLVQAARKRWAPSL